MIALNIAFRD